jgi:hypothetical protein
MYLKLIKSYVPMNYGKGKGKDRYSRREQNNSTQSATDPYRERASTSESRRTRNQSWGTPRAFCSGTVERTEATIGGILRSQIGSTRSLIAYHENHLEELKGQLQQLELLLESLERDKEEPS